jgi:hypothetical protein
MCVSAPDSVLAEAGAMRPRPSFASSLLTAEPTARLLWWPERAELSGQMLTRLKWLLEVSRGEAWLMLDDSDEESLSATELAQLFEETGIAVGPAVRLESHELAHRITPSPQT